LDHQSNFVIEREGVEHTGTIPAVPHDTCTPQVRQMTGEEGLGKTEDRLHLTYTRLSVEQDIHNPEAARIRQGFEDSIKLSHRIFHICG
jgi:hypothetical protein